MFYLFTNLSLFELRSLISEVLFKVKKSNLNPYFAKGELFVLFLVFFVYLLKKIMFYAIFELFSKLILVKYTSNWKIISKNFLDTHFGGNKFSSLPST